MKYRIKGALGGGFGGCENQDWDEIEVESEDEAIDAAYEMACEAYESYVGLYGLRTVDEIMEQDEIEDEDEALDVFYEERETWLDYEWEKVEA